MKIIIIGAGEVGTQLCMRLSLTEHDITVVDKNQKKLFFLDQNSDVLTINGSGSDLECLLEAKVQETDVLIATTNMDEINIVSCLLAKKNNVKITVGRIRNFSMFHNQQKKIKNSLSLNELGINLLLNPEELSMKRVLKLLEFPACFEYLKVGKTDLTIRGFKVGSSSRFIHAKIANLNDQDERFKNVLFLAFVRNRSIKICSGQDVFEEGDLIYMIASGRDFDFLEEYLHVEKSKSISGQNICVYGISKLTERLCYELLDYDITVKILEESLGVCEEFQNKFEKIQSGSGRRQLKLDVVCVDPTENMDMLDIEGLEEADCFFSLSENEEKNLLWIMLVKNLYGKRTFAWIQNKHYKPFTFQLGIDVVIDPKTSTAAEILRILRKEASFFFIGTFANQNVETFSHKVNDSFRYLKIPLNQIPFPNNSLVASIIRRGKPILPKGDHCFEIGDKIILFAYEDVIKKLDQFF